MTRLIKPLTLGLEGAATEKTYLEQMQLISALKCKMLLKGDHIVKTRDSTVEENWKQGDCGGILLYVMFSDAYFSQSRLLPSCVLT